MSIDSKEESNGRVSSTLAEFSVLGANAQAASMQQSLKASTTTGSQKAAQEANQ